MRLLSRTLLALCLSLAPSALAEPGWSQPPPEVLEVLHAPDLPRAWLSPTGAWMALADVDRYPPLADLSRPLLRLAGARFDPDTRVGHGETCARMLTLKRVSDGLERPLSLPEGACVLRFSWAADGEYYAFTTRASGGAELWLGETEEARPRRVKKLRLNPVLGSALQWMPDQRTLLVKQVPPDLGPPPAPPETPLGPMVQETSGASAISTYEARDLLASPYDELLFAHYGRSQLALVDARSGRVRATGLPGLIGDVSPSPDGKHLLLTRLARPFSRRVAWYRFERDIEVWSVDGRMEYLAACPPVADQVPIHGVPTGPRDHTWRATAPATLMWLEALDGGDPGRAAPERDRVLLVDAPFESEPREVHRAAHRVDAWWWGQDGLLLVEEWERERRWLHTWAINADNSDSDRKKILDRSAKDRYGDPGWPLQRQLESGAWVLVQEGDDLFFAGQGSSPEGDRPFLDRRSLETLEVERLFRSEAGAYEQLVGWVGAGTFLTRRESPTEVPNYHLRTISGRVEGQAAGEAVYASTARPVTTFPDATPQLRGIQRRIVTYTRADGVPLSFQLYLPPGYQEGTRLPTVLTAYPFEYSDLETAGQVSGSEHTFTRLSGSSPLFLLLSGYAVLSNTSIPVIGDPDTAYDSFVEQVVASAEAAVQKATELGVTDPDRVGVWGHSHGALMVATLLAHSDLFKAGVARSGAYNHTMRPFGFQNERRTLWQARDTYLHLSPVMHANQIDEPLLLIHGAADQNPGTVPLQSEKLYDAIRGTGGTARLVMLPNELHGYVARESVEQVLAEQVQWFDRWVKGEGG